MTGSGVPLKVLVVDDTILYRKIVSDILAELPGVEVVGSASDGKIALSRIEFLKPDLVTLDVEMPAMNGLEVLSAIKARGLDVGVIMLSSFTQQGSDMTVKALELGAFDFVTKLQEGGDLAENKKAISGTLSVIVKAFMRRKEIRAAFKAIAPPPSANGQAAPAPASVVHRMRSILDKKRAPSEVVAIGVSTGGPNALASMMPRIPANLGVPILIVQHMPPRFTQSLASSLNTKCPIEVREAVDGEMLLPNVAYIAQGGKQMKVAVMGDGSKIVRITGDPPENGCRPSADYLFRSIAYTYKDRATGVIMTGMGSDGTLGLKLMKRFGAAIIAQDEATCVVYGMPKAPIEAGIVDVVSPLDQIAAEICRTVKN